MVVMQGPHANRVDRISQPEIKAPWAISMAMLFTYVAGWLYNIVLCFCMVRTTSPHLLLWYRC
jgi:hypothetical protein